MKNKIPYISICIPAYKRVKYLEKLLKSIEEQTYVHFEVIITDDSGDDNSVEVLAKKYSQKLPLRYFKNPKALGTPANWNAVIALANGNWIKLMHDDDWFTEKASLEKLANATENANFIFSGYHLAKADDLSITTTYTLTKYHEFLLKLSPLNLLKQNYIGHPSTTLIKKSEVANWYDTKVKWVVDIEFYIRLLKKQRFYTVKEPLISIGMSDSQVTSHVFRKREVEIPENIYLLQQLGNEVLNNIIVYDYFWRVWRNLKIRKISEVTSEMNKSQLQCALQYSLQQMINFQIKLPFWILNVGIFSKFFMLLCYLKIKLLENFSD